MKKMEFSKKIAIWVLVGYAFFVCIIIALITFFGADLVGVLGIITPLPVAVISFYYNKSKGENLKKIEQSFVAQDVETEG
jgi:O-antigen/teichoic acid export membrane protein